MRPHVAAYSDRPELYGVTCAEAHVTHTIRGQFIPTARDPKSIPIILL